MSASRVLFDVTGKGEFPLDMLRYDTCWPYDPQSVYWMTATHVEGKRTITLMSDYPPNTERWDSFLWKVTNVRKHP